MSGRAELLLARREELLARSGRLRGRLGAETAAIGARLHWMQSLVALAISRPVRWVLTVGAAFVGIGRPRWLLRVAGRVVMLYPVIRPVLPLVGRWWRARAVSRS